MKEFFKYAAIEKKRKKLKEIQHGIKKRYKTFPVNGEQ